MAEFLASEAALKVLALLTLCVCLIGLGVALSYSVPYAVQRLRRHRDPSARRTFARFNLFHTILPSVILALFLAVALVLLLLPDTGLRAGIARLLVFAIVILVATLVIGTPIGHRAVEEQRSEEMQAAGRRER